MVTNKSNLESEKLWVLNVSNHLIGIHRRWWVVVLLESRSLLYLCTLPISTYHHLATDFKDTRNE